MDMVFNSLRGNWFTTQGLDGLVSFDSGTRAGDSLADILFAFVIAKVLRDCAFKIKELGFHDCVDFCQHFPLAPASVVEGDFSEIILMIASFGCRLVPLSFVLHVLRSLRRLFLIVLLLMVSCLVLKWARPIFFFSLG